MIGRRTINQIEKELPQTNEMNNLIKTKTVSNQFIIEPHPDNVAYFQSFKSLSIIRLKKDTLLFHL